MITIGTATNKHHIYLNSTYIVKPYEYVHIRVIQLASICGIKRIKVTYSYGPSAWFTPKEFKQQFYLNRVSYLKYINKGELPRLNFSTILAALNVNRETISQCIAAGVVTVSAVAFIFALIRVLI